MIYPLLILNSPDLVQGQQSSVIALFAAIFGFAALLASGACLYLAFRLFKMLRGAPRLEDSFGFEKYQGSALDEVCKLRESVNQLGGKFGASLRTVSETVRQAQASIADQREQIQIYASASTRLQKDLDNFREGFLLAHIDHILGRLLDLKECAERLEGKELKNAALTNVDAICEAMLVETMPGSDFLDKPFRQVVDFCEKIQSIDAEGPENDGRIATVNSPAFIVSGTPGGRRVLRKAKVSVYKLKASAAVVEPVDFEKDSPSNDGTPAPSHQEIQEPAVKETEA